MIKRCDDDLNVMCDIVSCDLLHHMRPHFFFLFFSHVLGFGQASFLKGFLKVFELFAPSLLWDAMSWGFATVLVKQAFYLLSNPFLQVSFENEQLNI